MKKNEKVLEHEFVKITGNSEDLTNTTGLLHIPLQLNSKLSWTPCIKVSFCFAYRLDNSFLEVAERLALPNVATFSQLFLLSMLF